MRTRMMLAAAALLAGPALGQAGAGQRNDSRKMVRQMSGKTVDPEAEAALANCAAHKFEASAEVGEGKAKRVTRIKLCGKAGDSDEAWIATLQKAGAQIKASEQLPEESRAKLIAAIDAEIARIQAPK